MRCRKNFLRGDRCLPQGRCRLFDTINNRPVKTVQLLLVEAVATTEHSDGPEKRDDRVPAGIKHNCKSKSRKTPMRPTIVATNKLTVRGKRHHHPAWSALTDQNPTRRCNFFNVNGLSRQVQWVTPTPIPANRQFPTVYLETAGQRPQTKPTASTPVPKTVAPVTLSPWLNRPAQTGSSGEPANRNQQLGILWGDPAFFGGKVIELSLARAARKISQKNFVPAQHVVGIRDHFPVPPAPCAEVIPGCWAQIPHLSTSPGRQLHRISPAV